MNGSLLKSQPAAQRLSVLKVSQGQFAPVLKSFQQIKKLLVLNS
jgi:hypothetical protein